MHQNDEYLAQVLAAGASGYVLKDAAGRELVLAIRQVARGEPFFSPSDDQDAYQPVLEQPGGRADA